MNAGADGSLILPAEFPFRDFGPLPLFDGTLPGEYELNCRLVEPVTGRQIFFDRNTFMVEEALGE